MIRLKQNSSVGGTIILHMESRCLYLDVEQLLVLRVRTICHRVVDVITRVGINAKRLSKNGCNMTGLGKKLFDEQVKLSTNLSVQDHNNSTYYVRVSRSKNPQHKQTMYELGLNIVNPDDGSCVRCGDRHHLHIPCQHLLAVLFKLSKGKQLQTNYNVEDFFHDSYLGSSLSAISSVTIPLPSSVIESEENTAIVQASRKTKKCTKR